MKQPKRSWPPWDLLYGSDVPYAENGTPIKPDQYPQAPEIYQTEIGGLRFSASPHGYYVDVTVPEGRARFRKEHLKGLACYLRDLARRMALYA